MQMNVSFFLLFVGMRGWNGDGRAKWVQSLRKKGP